MTDIKSPALLYFKGALFVLLGCVSLVAILLKYPDLYLAGLLVIAIWSFCRAYYFAFYVIEHYIDPQFRFAGLFAFVQYLLSRKQREPTA